MEIVPQTWGDAPGYDEYRRWRIKTDGHIWPTAKLNVARGNAPGGPGPPNLGRYPRLR
ncbi:MAG: hypothetical protein ACK6DQ_05530 [Planctomycetota bacterium]